MALVGLRLAVGRVARVVPHTAACGRAVVAVRSASSDTGAPKHTHIKVERVGSGGIVGLITLNRPKGEQGDPRKLSHTSTHSCTAPHPPRLQAASSCTHPRCVNFVTADMSGDGGVGNSCWCHLCVRCNHSKTHAAQES
jgi:hypothetical protein